MAKATAYDALVKVWHWYSRDHALAATLFCRKCGELEKSPAEPSVDEKSRGLTWSEAQAAEHRSCAVAAILTCVAFLEASLNELLGSASEDSLELGGGKGGLQKSERSALIDLREAWGRSGPPLLDRVQLVLHLLRREPFNTGAQPYQHAQLLMQLRNALVHYRPEWRAAGGVTGEDAIAKRLALLKFTAHPFTTSANPFFPDICLGHSCASWSWNSVFSFTEDFFTRVRVTPVYADLRSQLTLRPADGAA